MPAPTIRRQPSRVDVVIVRGDDVTIPVAFVDSDGDPIDCSGMELAVHVWQGAHELTGWSVTAVDDTVGTFQLSIASDDSEAIAGHATWALVDSAANTTIFAGRHDAKKRGQSGIVDGASTVNGLVVTLAGASTIEIQLVSTGAAGVPGEGVPTGGTAGQVLTKDSSDDYDTSWQDPAGGSAVLSDDAPEPLGTESAGISTEASRSDHVHDMPSASDVGADPAGTAAGLVDDLSGVSNQSTARTNLGLGGAATLNVGTASGTVAAGNDARFTDARTPTAHTHPASDITSGLATVATSGDYDDLTGKPSIPDGIPTGGTTGQVLAKDTNTNYDVSWQDPSGGGVTLSSATPSALGTAAAGSSGDASRSDHVHAMPTAANVGADPAGTAAALVDDLSGVSNQSTARTNLGLGGAATLNVGTTAGTVAAGDDSRLSDARTPTSHTHPASDITSGLATVATSGDYDDLSNLPTIPAAGIPAGGTTGQTLRKTSATNYETEWDTLTASDVGAAASSHTHAASDITSGLAAVATSGDYDDLSNAPTIPEGIPTGGTTGQVLAKDTSTNYDVSWTTPSSGPALSSATPSALGTAAAGSSGDAARADHVHAMPTAANVGADPAGTAAALVDDLSGVSNQSTARTNLGLGGAATLNVGTTAGTVAAGDDSRLSDARTPTTHSHSATDVTSGTMGTARLGSGTANSTTFLRGDSTWAAVTADVDWAPDDVVVTTGSLADDATATGTVTMAAGWRLLNVATDEPARVRLYVDTDARTADASREIGTDPTGPHGVLLDLVTDDGELDWPMSPAVDGWGSPCPYAITNLSGATDTIEVTFTWVRTF